LLFCYGSSDGLKPGTRKDLAPAGTYPSRQRCCAATLRVRRDERRRGATTLLAIKSRV